MDAAYALNGILVAVLCFIGFSRYSGLLFNGLDGANMLTNVAFQYAWTKPAAGFYANPLQGLADIWFSFNAWLSPGFTLPHLLLDDIDVADPLFQVSVYTAHAVMLFVAVVIAMRSFGMSRTAGLIGAWASVTLMLPVFGIPLVYPILQLQPNVAFTITEVLLIAAAVSHLGRHHGPSKWPTWRDGAAAFALLLISVHFLLISPTSLMLAMPFLVFVTAGLLGGAATRSEQGIKFAGLLLAATVLIVSGFAEYVSGIFGYTAARFSSGSFQNTRMEQYFVSILFQAKEHGLGGPILATSGIAGLAYASFFAQPRLRWFARSALAFASIIVIFGWVTTEYDFWHGPSPIYLETLLWPIYASLTANLVVSFVLICKNWVFGDRRIAIAENYAESMLLASVALVFAIIFASTFQQVAPVAKRENYPYPPSQPAIVEMLKDQIGLSLGAPVRGRVATFALQYQSAPATWNEFHTADHFRVKYVGNDFHTVGLWYFGIPTLLEYAPTLSPPLFEASTRLLARPEDRQQRSVLVLRKPNVSALAVLGIRYVLTDAPAAPPLRLIDSAKIHDSVSLYLYEVPGAILSAASPTTVEVVETFNAALDRFSDPQFNPHNSVMMTSADSDGIDPNGLSSAEDVSVRLTRGGFDIDATSDGTSLLVLPFQFSHCLTLDAGRARVDSAKLIRVNAFLTGVLFNRELSGTLRYFTGPFDGKNCRLKDARDFSRAIIE